MDYFLLSHRRPGSGYIDGSVAFEPPLPAPYRPASDMPLEGRRVAVRMDKAVRRLKADFFSTTSGAVFASDELAALLKDFQKDLEFIPAETSYLRGEPTEKKFKLVHARHAVPCFDHRRSEYAGKAYALTRLERGESPDSFLVKGVEKIVIDEDLRDGAQYFFLRNALVLPPIVSGELAAAMRAHGLAVHLDATAVD